MPLAITVCEQPSRHITSRERPPYQPFRARLRRIRHHPVDTRGHSPLPKTRAGLSSACWASSRRIAVGMVSEPAASGGFPHRQTRHRQPQASTLRRNGNAIPQGRPPAIAKERPATPPVTPLSSRPASPCAGLPRSSRRRACGHTPDLCKPAVPAAYECPPCHRCAACVSSRYSALSPRSPRWPAPYIHGQVRPARLALAP